MRHSADHPYLPAVPTRPARPCPGPGCRNTTTSGYCPACTAARPAPTYDDYRASARTRGYDTRHRRWRTLILHRDPVCRYCSRAPSTVADHITALRSGGSWSLDNGAGACTTCHNRKTAAERHGQKIPIPVPRTVVSDAMATDLQGVG